VLVATCYPELLHTRSPFPKIPSIPRDWAPAWVGTCPIACCIGTVAGISPPNSGGGLTPPGVLWLYMSRKNTGKHRPVSCGVVRSVFLSFWHWKCWPKHGSEGMQVYNFFFWHHTPRRKSDYWSNWTTADGKLAKNECWIKKKKAADACTSVVHLGWRWSGRFDLVRKEWHGERRVLRSSDGRSRTVRCSGSIRLPWASQIRTWESFQSTPNQTRSAG
jgi:hypothetical protein